MGRGMIEPLSSTPSKARGSGRLPTISTRDHRFVVMLVCHVSLRYFISRPPGSECLLLCSYLYGKQLSYVLVFSGLHASNSKRLSFVRCPLGVERVEMATS